MRQHSTDSQFCKIIHKFCFCFPIVWREWKTFYNDENCRLTRHFSHKYTLISNFILSSRSYSSTRDLDKFLNLGSRKSRWWWHIRLNTNPLLLKASIMNKVSWLKDLNWFFFAIQIKIHEFFMRIKYWKQEKIELFLQSATAMQFILKLWSNIHVFRWALVELMLTNAIKLRDVFEFRKNILEGLMKSDRIIEI